ncbi:hypothetical protein HU200_063982 [Digitaria exilis]|uniref:Aminotransferase-like plant mobile domain-containing protein n=1 Tax=Digitaria exilis TaxID=1010633 RepID=A0A835DUV6_9POAL|nr:hypothetical protein HU200_063982 [Digitaria exilis]
MNEFNDEQRGAVKDSGLGSLLKLNKLVIRRDLCKEIANTFDLETEEFDIGGKRVRMSMKESEHILSLPSEGDEIKEPPKSTLKEYFSNNKTSGEDFISHFVLYAIGLYMCPTLQTYVNSEYLALIEDVANIKNLNWTSLVHNFLIASIREYRRVPSTNLKGNLALLQVSQYFHVTK